MNGPELLGLGESGLESAGVGSGSQWECRGRGRSGCEFMAGAAVECVTDVWGEQLELRSVGEFEESRAPTHR